MSFQRLLRSFMANQGFRAPTGGSLGGMGALLALGGVGIVAANAMYNVEGGHRAVIFNRLSGVDPVPRQPGTHFLVPWLESRYIFDVRAKPQEIRSPTGTKDLQMVDITLRVLYNPDPQKVPRILSTLGSNYAEVVLPSLVHETLKAIVAQFNAAQLITRREQVSHLIRRNLIERAAEFDIQMQDVSITHITFGSEYKHAIEAKQVAQQDAERAKYQVRQALEDKKSTIIEAQGEAKSAQLIGDAIRRNPAYVELRRLEAANEIAQMVARSNNKVYVDSDSLLLNILKESGNRLSADSKV